MKLQFIITVLMLASVVRADEGQGLPSGQITSQSNLRSVFKWLWPAVAPNGGAASIYYSTVCHADGATLPFPRVEVQPPSKGTAGIAAVRQIFSRDRNVKVVQDQTGMIRIIVGEIQATAIGKRQMALLQTRIHLVKLDRTERYSPALALDAILQSKEFKSAMRKLRIGYPTTISSGGVNQPERGLPHLPGSFKEITIEQALDMIAKTFGCVILYKTCAENNEEGFVTFDVRGVGDYSAIINGQP